MKEKGSKHTGKIHRGEKMHMKSKKGGGKMESSQNKGENLPSICDADCFSPGEEYKGGKGHNEKHG